MTFFLGFLVSLGQQFGIDNSLLLGFGSTVTFCAMICLFLWRRCGVTSLWIFGALVLGFLGSGFASFVGTGLRIMYWVTSSSFCKLNSFLIFPVLLGPSLLGMTRSVRPGMS